MTALVKEEISHFKMVHDKLIERGYTLGRDRRDDYVLQLLKFFPKGGSRTTQLVHRLLYAALIRLSGDTDSRTVIIDFTAHLKFTPVGLVLSNNS